MTTAQTELTTPDLIAATNELHAAQKQMEQCFERVDHILRVELVEAKRHLYLAGQKFYQAQKKRAELLGVIHE